MKHKIFNLASSAFAMVALVGCQTADGAKPQYCEPGSSERCPYVKDAPMAGERTVVVPRPGREY